MKQDPQQPYSGIGNLEVMAEAENYNHYLVSLVTCDTPSGSKLVDFGAGDGTLATLFANLGFSVTCVEPDAVLSKKLGDKRFTTYNSISQLGQSALDYVYSFNVLEHIEDDCAACCEIFSALRPGGRLMIYVPAFQLLYSSMDRKVGHYRRYTRQSLAQCLKAAGFTVERTFYVDSLGFLASLAFRAFGNESGEISRSTIIRYDRLLFPLSRALDHLTRTAFGKNVIAYATKRI